MHTVCSECNEMPTIRTQSPPIPGHWVMLSHVIVGPCSCLLAYCELLLLLLLHSWW